MFDFLFWLVLSNVIDEPEGWVEGLSVIVELKLASDAIWFKLSESINVIDLFSDIGFLFLILTAWFI